MPSFQAREIELLLDRLCIDLGFCIPPLDRQRLIESPPTEVTAFADAVLDAEGLQPHEISLSLYRQVKRFVDETFQRLDVRHTH